MNNVKAILIIMVLMTAAPNVFAENFTRASLLDEGRRSVNTLQDYDRISTLDYNFFADVNIKSFMPYQVDTKQGPDSVYVILGAISTKFSMGGLLDFYVISNGYLMFSSKRRQIITNDNGELDLDEGKAQFEDIFYGGLVDVYTGFDVKLAILKIQIDGIITYENLSNTEYETRDFTGQEVATDKRLGNYSGGIQYDASGKPLYRRVTEKEKVGFIPVFGISLFGIEVIDIRGVVAFAGALKEITANEVLMDVNFTRSLTLTFGYNYYSYWNNEYGLIGRVKASISIVQLSAGIEYLFKNQYIAEAFVEFIVGFGGRKKNSINKRKRNPRTRYYASHGYYFLLRLNFARTPETIEIKNTNAFSKGVKVGIGGRSFWALKWELFFMYNIYEDLKVFRRAVDKYGLGANFSIVF